MFKRKSISNRNNCRKISHKATKASIPNRPHQQEDPPSVQLTLGLTASPWSIAAALGLSRQLLVRLNLFKRSSTLRPRPIFQLSSTENLYKHTHTQIASHYYTLIHNCVTASSSLWLPRILYIYTHQMPMRHSRRA